MASIKMYDPKGNLVDVDRNQQDSLLGQGYSFKKSTTTPTAPAGQVGLRDAAESSGLNVGWSQETGPTINGTPVSTSGLQMTGNKWYGSQEQINQLLSPFQQQSAQQATQPDPTVYPDTYAQDKTDAYNDYKTWSGTNFDYKFEAELENKFREILSRQFNYDPANDAQFQKASKELTRNVMESMNARGILNSTVTENQVQQGVSDLLPQYQQIARQQFMDEGNQLMSQVDMLMGDRNTQYSQYQDEGKRYADVLGVVMEMSDDDYRKWSDAYERRHQVERDRINDEQTKIENERQKVRDAWERVDNMRYADNEAALILGIDPGTLSREAQIAKDEAEQRMKEQRQSLSNQLAVINAQYEKEKKISQIRDADSSETQGTAEQVSMYNQLRDIYFGGGYGKYANDPMGAYNWLMSHRADNVSLIGDKLYERLVGELEDSMKMQKSYGEKEPTPKASDYKNDPDFAANVAYIVANPETALEEIEKNAEQIIQDYTIDGYNYLLKKAMGE